MSLPDDGTLSDAETLSLPRIAGEAMATSGSMLAKVTTD